MGSLGTLTYEEAKAKIEPLLKKRFGWDEIPSFDSLSPDQGKTIVPCLEYLLSLKGEAAKLYLWNSIRFPLGKEARKAGCSPKLCAYLSRHDRARRHYRKSTRFLLNDNLNKSILTERLILRGEASSRGTDLAEYQKHLREEGDFTIFTSLPLTEENMAISCLFRKFRFIIVAKDDGRMLGYCGFFPDPNVKDGSDWSSVQVEYYVFKNERGHGYAFEALTALIEQAFRKGLWALVPGSYCYLVMKKRISIRNISGLVQTKNEASIHVLEKLGFRRTILPPVSNAEVGEKDSDTLAYILKSSWKR
jgi:RimJ/RimL family protein N-acetyltransferase